MSNTCNILPTNMSPDKLLKLKALIMKSLRTFFESKGYVECFIPGITKVTGSCEAVANIFTLEDIPFSTLRQTAQLDMEALLVESGLTKMFTGGRSFRKELITWDGRHLSDFELFEYEALDMDLDGLLELNEQMLIQLMQDVLVSNLLNRSQTSTLNKYYEHAIEHGVTQIPYSDAVDHLSRKLFMVKDEKGKERCIEYGDDLNSQAERILTEEYGILHVTHYPEEIKFFNMLRSREHYNQGNVDCADLLLPLAGETIGGSAREYDYNILTEKLTNSVMLKHLNDLAKQKQWAGDGETKVIDVFQPYLNLFEKNDLPRAGAGMGLARVMQFLLSSERIMPF